MAILLNLREFDGATHLNHLVDLSELVLGANDKLYVVDGQHRVEALVRLYRESSAGKEKIGGSLRSHSYVCWVLIAMER